jgi:hypothetical protein
MQWEGTRRPSRVIRWVHMLLLAALAGALLPHQPAATAAAAPAPDQLGATLRAASPAPALTNGIDLTNDILGTPSTAFDALASSPAADLSIARMPAARSVAELNGDVLSVVLRGTNHQPPAARDLLPLQTSPTLSSTAALEHNRRPPRRRQHPAQCRDRR